MTPYVSCMYAPPDETGMIGNTKQGENARITCIDDQGRTWWLTEDSEVGDWLDYVGQGGTVEPYVAKENDDGQPTQTKRRKRRPAKHAG